jgi:hypothetical protein
VPVRSAELKPQARRLGKLIRRLGATVQRTLIRHREEVLELFIADSLRRAESCLRGLHSNDDDLLLAAAEEVCQNP